jgi:hypothetical protein
MPSSVDAASLLTEITSVVQNFNLSVERLQNISARIGADNLLSATLAALPAATTRNLATANFDDLKTCIDLLTSLLGKTNGQTVTATQNTGGTVQLAFFRML